MVATTGRKRQQHWKSARELANSAPHMTPAIECLPRVNTGYSHHPLGACSTDQQPAGNKPLEYTESMNSNPWKVCHNIGKTSTDPPTSPISAAEISSWHRSRGLRHPNDCSPMEPFHPSTAAKSSFSPSRRGSLSAGQTNNFLSSCFLQNAKSPRPTLLRE